MNHRPFRSIANLLIRRTVALAFLCMLVVFGVQSWLLSRQHQQQFDTVMADVAGTSVPLLAVGLWDIEPQAVQAQIGMIARRPAIGFVRLRATGGQYFEAGNQDLSTLPVSRRITITSPRGGMALGELELVGNPGYLWDEIWAEAHRILLWYGTLTAGICVLIAAMLKQLLQRPLSNIAKFARDLNPQHLTTPLQLNRPVRRYRDEIDLLQEGFVKLQNGLRQHIHNLDGLVNERTVQLEQLLEEIRHLSMTDALTGAYNRRALEERLPGELERAHRYERPLALIFIDIDHFKQINDTYGHAAGDEVLRSAALHIGSSLRQGVDWLARYGGEEFVVVLPETDLTSAHATAERLRVSLPALEIPFGDAHLRITASFGATAYREGEDSANLLARADALVYQAKADGRHRVVSSR